MKKAARLMIRALLMVAVLATTSEASAGTSARRAADEKALRDSDSEWSKAASEGDVDRTVSFYTDDATLLPPNAPVVSGREAIRREWADILKGFSGTLHWHATKVEVSRSGDIGYTIGRYEGTFTPPNGKPAQDRGKYLEVWKKQANGQWKCVADMYSSDLGTGQ
jgi:uncharacterized protein (TIGR02246 family)